MVYGLKVKANNQQPIANRQISFVSRQISIILHKINPTDF